MLLTPLLLNGALPLLNVALCRSQEAGTAHAEPTDKAANTQLCVCLRQRGPRTGAAASARPDAFLPNIC